MEEYKDLPYGIADFKNLIQQGYYYVDKTPFIKTMRATPYLLLLRPRRFGKSLFLSMLRYYYDIAERDNFETLFKGTWIFENPTYDWGTYQVLLLDFSKIGDTSHNLPEKFNEYCCAQTNIFMERYKDAYPEQFYKDIRECPSFDTKLNLLSGYAKEIGARLCLLVDEYDNFTNTILATRGHDVYHAITHADGFYRDVFKIFKGMFDRIVLTGVSPVTLDDLTSGFNIAENVSLTKQFNNVLGFTTDEVQKMLHYYIERALIPNEEDRMLKEMEAWYDGYCFSEKCLKTGMRIFNSNMVIRYLRSYINDGDAPSNMLDSNTRTDYTKLHQLLHLDCLNGDRKSVLMEIAQEGYTSGKIEDSFPAHRLTDPTLFKSLLFYYGMVSITGIQGAWPKLGIPNNNVRVQYYNYLVEEISKIQHVDTKTMDAVYEAAALEGKWQEMVAFLCTSYHKYSSVRSAIEGERNVQGFFLAYLSLNPYYLTAPEVEVNHGYCDFFLMPDMVRVPSMAHSYIIELKYLSSSDTEAKAELQWQEAVEQIHRYVQAPNVRLLCNRTKLHGIILQIKGTELYRTEEVVGVDFTENTIVNN
jgi:hypothetical protein